MAYNCTVRKLSEVRAGWEAIEAEETRLLREMTIEQSLAIYAKLQRAWEAQLRATESEFRGPRLGYLKQLQERLAKLEQWREPKMDQLYTSVLKLQQRLASAGIPSAIIGGVAVGVWGDPRVTRDVDLKVLLRRDDAERLWGLLQEDYRPLHHEPIEALRGHGFLFLHDADEIRLDVLLAETTFDESAVRRARSIKLSPDAEFAAWVCAPEDLIVYKMISLRDIDRRDAAMLVKRVGDKLDDRYIEKWLKEFEQALDEGSLIAEFRRLRQGPG